MHLLRQLLRSCACCPQIYGPESSGKTTLALHAIAEVQKKGGIACFVDAEHAFDPEYAQVGAGASTRVWSTSIGP